MHFIAPLHPLMPLCSVFDFTKILQNFVLVFGIFSNHLIIMIKGNGYKKENHSNTAGY